MKNGEDVSGKKNEEKSAGIDNFAL